MSINITLKNKDGIVLKTQDTLCREDIVIIPDSSILGDEINLQDKTITVNGTITADEGYDGLGTVTVAVPDTIPNLQDKTETITANGTTTITSDDAYDGLNSVSVTVNVPVPTYEVYAGETEAAPPGFNVTYKAGIMIPPGDKPEAIVNLTYIDGSTARYRITYSAYPAGYLSLPSDWEEQTGVSPDNYESGDYAYTTGKGYTWKNVVSINITTRDGFNIGEEEDDIYVYVNESKVGTSYTANLTEDITIYASIW